MTIKQIALDALTKKFEGISDAVLSRIAAKVAKTAKNEEEVTTTVEEMTLQNIIDSYTDSRVTEGSEKAVKTYEQKYGLKDGEKLEAKPEPETEKIDIPANDDTPAYVKEMLNSIKSLSEEVASLKAGKTEDSRKGVVNKLLEGCPDKKKNSIMREFSRINFKDDKDFDSWIEEISPDINDAKEAFNAERNASITPKAGGGSKDNKPNEQVMQRVDAMLKNNAVNTTAIKGLQSNN